ncbi:hypothetical protein [Sphingomonas sp.]|uniref:hypothetical protein n=1 Tax=Sphingomonas sp. TaxID=28214 RepID=UPI003CC64FDB
MTLPMRLLPLWAAFTLATAGLLPVLAYLLDLLGLLIASALLAAAVFGGIALVGYSVLDIGLKKGHRASASVHALIILAVVLLGLCCVHSVAEISWQALNGSRNVPIWP